MKDILNRLGLTEDNSGAWAGSALDTSTGERVAAVNPATEETIAHFYMANADHLETESN